MTSEEFKYWISGYLSLSTEDYLNHHQINIINNHANLVQAVSGNVDKEIINFIIKLDNEIKSNSKIPLSKIREFYFSNFFENPVATF